MNSCRMLFCGDGIMGGQMCVAGIKDGGTDKLRLCFFFFFLYFFCFLLIIFESNKHYVSIKPFINL